ncbi:hypothetical protein F0562_019607 [Nyssa sinensis]|uniref:Uncharacterized protein n=1 Tax=Nyssa sinensis TaxID=561372 RepID=A0A5J5BSS7_9ASTE|nr:hypothetical protein F0562_019607 [Nyssa sinensis]
MGCVLLPERDRVRVAVMAESAKTPIMSSYWPPVSLSQNLPSGPPLQNSVLSLSSHHQHEVSLPFTAIESPGTIYLRLR